MSGLRVRLFGVLLVGSLVAAACGSEAPSSSGAAARDGSPSDGGTESLALADGCVSGSVAAPSGMVAWWPFDLRDEDGVDVDAGVEISGSDTSARSDALVVGAPVNPVARFLARWMRRRLVRGRLRR